MGFAPDLGWLFVGRFLSGIAGASFTRAYAFVADISPREKRAQNFGLISASFGIGFIIGPAIGGLLGSFGPRAPFFVAAAVSLANFVYGTFVLPESLPPERRRPFEWSRANPLGTLLRMRRHPAILGLLAALFLWALGHQVMPAVWAFYTKYRFEWSEATIGASLALAGALMALSQATLVRVLVPRWGERRTALTGIAVACVGYVGYGFATQSWMMFAWLLTWLFGAMVMPTTNAYMSHQIEPDAQGELQGAVAGLYSLSSIAGPPIMTQLFARFTATSAPLHLPGAPFLAAAVLTACCFVLYALAARDRGARVPPEPAFEDAADVSGSAAEQPDRKLANAQLRQLLEQCIDELPDAFRTVFMLRAVEQCSISTTAEILEIQEATVKTRFHRARLLLQKRLLDFSEESGVAVHEFAGHRCDAIVSNVLNRLRSGATSKVRYPSPTGELGI
jgi:DHA1 family tetracycline resistance protein-like MFS transporter